MLACEPMDKCDLASREDVAGEAVGGVVVGDPAVVVEDGTIRRRHTLEASPPPAKGGSLASGVAWPEEQPQVTWLAAPGSRITDTREALACSEAETTLEAPGAPQAGAPQAPDQGRAAAGTRALALAPRVAVRPSGRPAQVKIAAIYPPVRSTEGNILPISLRGQCRKRG